MSWLSLLDVLVCGNSVPHTSALWLAYIIF